MRARQTPFPIVGVGASAGGVEALESLFRGTPADTGCAFVVVTHLSPDRPSLLPEILARYTAMPVLLAADGVTPEPNQVHVLPSDAVLDMDDGHLRVRKSISLRRERKPIDVFFAALARDHGEYAAGVVLSGSDGDGTLGVKAIKERGGLTLAQIADGKGPQHPDMPNSAIASGMIDIAATAEDIGGHLARFARSFDEFDRLVAAQRRGLAERRRQEICAIVRNQLGHDFSGYKGTTFLRRVQRRMQVNHVGKLEDYIERLRQDPKEVVALFRDLLINVTNFFRDPEAFQVLEREVIPKLFAGRGADETIRVWTPGCATGEEAYSIAILMQEHSQHLAAKPRVQIFATDIDEPALAVARAARYPGALLDSVSEERRKRFFIREDGTYQLVKEVRDLCVFSPHSVIRDPPFSRLDLISCRNLLIYFGPDIQNQVLPTFHYALRPGGFLFLGASENVSQFGELFSAIDKKHRVFRSRDTGSSGVRLPLSLTGIRATPSLGSRAATAKALGGIALRQSVESQVLERFTPAHVVVNREGDVVFYSGRTGKYLEASPGAPTRQLVVLARKGLRLDLRTCLKEALETDRRVERTGLLVEGDDDKLQRVKLRIEPVIDSPPDDRLLLVVFEDVGPTISREEAAQPQGYTDEAITQLERELRETRERLQSLVEEYETALEELKSSNEELVSVNEELQSTNEELEASKEELQSLNEELHTVNIELTGKVDQLDRANADLTNLFESSKVATVFLDRKLVIRSFTPAASKIFKILPSDRGRPLTDLASQVDLPTLDEDLQTVLASGNTIERTIDHEGGRSYYLLRLVPYRDPDQKIAGVVLTFIDVTSLTRAEAHQKVLIDELNHRVKNMLTVVIGIAEQTSRNAGDVRVYKEELVDRLRAMAQSYELIARDNWTEALLPDLARLQVAPFGPDRIVLQGPELRLGPTQSLAIGMILHELATNASKYGAFTDPHGRVELQWELGDAEGEAVVRLLWRERDGPAISEPQRRGFGLRLIQREAAYALGGSAEIRFDPKGLQVTLTFPKVLAREPGPGPARKPSKAAAPAP